MKPILEAKLKCAHEEIAHCAYLIWESEGRPEGRALMHWMQAEVRLLAAGRIIAVPDDVAASSGVGLKSPPGRRRYGLVLTQKPAA